MLFVGVDWGERHHDLCLLDQDGSVLAMVLLLFASLVSLVVRFRRSQGCSANS